VSRAWTAKDHEQPGVVSSLACIRRSAAAMSVKSRPPRKEREKGRAPASAYGEGMGQPPSLRVARVRGKGYCDGSLSRLVLAPGDRAERARRIAITFTAVVLPLQRL